MIRYFGAVILSVALLTGCATYPDPNRARLERLPEHYVQFDAEVGWQVRSVGSRTLVEGEFSNIRFQQMDNVEVWVAVLDGDRKIVARSEAFIVPHLLGKGEVAPFSVSLPVAAPPGTLLRFTYNYGAWGDGDGRGGFWTQSFYAKVPNR